MDARREGAIREHAGGVSPRPAQLLRVARRACHRGTGCRPRDPGDVRRRAQGLRLGDVVGGASTRGDPDVAPVSDDRGAPSRRPDRQSRGRQSAVGDPETAHRDTGHQPARLRRRATSRSTTGIGRCSNCCTRRAHASPKRSDCRSATSTWRAGWSGCTARDRRSASCRSDRRQRARWTTGSRHGDGLGWCPLGGSVAMTPKRCS